MGEDDSSSGQIDFTGDLSALSEFITKLQAMSQQASSANPAMNQLNSTIDNLTKGFTSLNSAMSQNSLSGMANNVNNLNKSSQSLGSQINANTTSASGFSAVFAGAFGGNSLSMLDQFHMGINRITFGIQGLILATGGKELYNWLIGANQQIEVLQTSLEVTLKSTEAAQDAIRDLRSYASTTPFQETETLQAGEQFAANGMDINKWIQVAGDLASAKQTAGVQLNDVVNVLTRINAGDFGKAMIRLRQMGISLNDLREQGLKFSANNSFKGSTEDFLNAVANIVNTKYGGLTESLGQTFQGLLSTAKDFVQQLGIQLGSVSFDQLKSTMRDIKNGLSDMLNPDTANGEKFQKFIVEFNSTLDSFIKFVTPFVSTMGSMLSTLSEFLPQIGGLLQIFIRVQTFSSILTGVQAILSNVSIMGRNWATINSLIKASAEDLNADLVILNGETAVLTEHEILLTKINALRAAGNTLLTEEAAKQSLSTELTAMAGSSAVETTVGASGSLKAGQMFEGIGGVSAGLGARIPEIMAMVIGFQLLGSAIGSVSGLFKSHNEDLLTTASDYDRVVGSQQASLTTLESLSKARLGAIDDIKQYSDLQKELTSGTAASKFGDENLADVTNKLSDAKNLLARTNQQLIDSDVKLGATLVDTTGKLKDETGIYDENTAAINANILAKKLQIAQTYEKQSAAAQNENKVLSSQISDTAEVKKYLSQMNPIAEALSGAQHSLFGLVGEDDYASANKNYVQAHNLSLLSKSAQDAWFAQNAVDNNTKNQKIDSNNLISGQGKDAMSRGYTVTDPSTGAVLPDITRYQAFLKSQKDTTDALQAKMDATAASFQTLVTDSNPKKKQITDEWDTKLNEELAKNGNNDQSPAYTAIEQKKGEALSAYTSSIIKDVQDAYDKSSKSKIDALTKIDPALKILADAKIPAKDIEDAINTYNSTGQVLDTVKGYSDQLIEVANSMIDQTTHQPIPADTLDAMINDYNGLSDLTDAKDQVMSGLKLQQSQDALDSIAKSKKAAKESPYQLFSDQWEKGRKDEDLSNTIFMQNDELNNINPDSGQYRTDKNSQDQSAVNYIYSEMSALKTLMNSSDFKNSSTYIKDNYTAQTELLQLQSDANGLLLAIKNNTAQPGEYNKPGFVRALTYYDYASQDAKSSTIEISDAKFIMQITAPQTLADASNILDLFKKSLGDHIKKTESSGVNNAFLTS